MNRVLPSRGLLETDGSAARENSFRTRPCGGAPPLLQALFHNLRHGMGGAKTLELRQQRQQKRNHCETQKCRQGAEAQRHDKLDPQCCRTPFRLPGPAAADL